jgi:hypothetical protein
VILDTLIVPKVPGGTQTKDGLLGHRKLNLFRHDWHGHLLLSQIEGRKHGTLEEGGSKNDVHTQFN